MYQSTIVVDNSDMEQLFIPEDKTLNRATYTITKKGRQLIFNISADDATALKTAFNTITKIFLVWEKTSGLKNG